MKSDSSGNDEGPSSGEQQPQSNGTPATPSSPSCPEMTPLARQREKAIREAQKVMESMGTNQLKSLKSLKFKGNIYPIHPREKRVLDLEAYQSLKELPEVPDLAVIVLPTGIVPRVLEECGRKGIKHAIVVSGAISSLAAISSGRSSSLPFFCSAPSVRPSTARLRYGRTSSSTMSSRNTASGSNVSRSRMTQSSNALSLLISNSVCDSYSNNCRDSGPFAL